MSGGAEFILWLLHLTDDQLSSRLPFKSVEVKLDEDIKFISDTDPDFYQFPVMQVFSWWYTVDDFDDDDDADNDKVDNTIIIFK